MDIVKDDADDAEDGIESTTSKVNQTEWTGGFESVSYDIYLTQIWFGECNY